jgi:hypothetical protein
VTGDDLIAIAPWLAFAAGLAMIGYRLLTRGRPPAPPAPHPRTQQAPPPGRRQPPGTGSATGTRADDRSATAPRSGTDACAEEQPRPS